MFSGCVTSQAICALITYAPFILWERRFNLGNFIGKEKAGKIWGFNCVCGVWKLAHCTSAYGLKCPSWLKGLRAMSLKQEQDAPHFIALSFICTCLLANMIAGGGGREGVNMSGGGGGGCFCCMWIFLFSFLFFTLNFCPLNYYWNCLKVFRFAALNFGNVFVKFLHSSIFTRNYKKKIANENTCN